ncbi:MAG: integrase [Gammaproteobacteria bacterium]|nr:integrase [Gammaproteobacteria bacterium]
MKDLNFELAALCRRNRDGSISRRSRRFRNLQLFAKTLHELGFRHMRATSIKPKHVYALLEYWQTRGATPGTLHNYMAELRWWAEKVGRNHVMQPTNAAYGIPPRPYANSNKAQFLSDQEFERLGDPYVRMSARLQQAFGLRREEAMKFQPRYADRRDHIALKGTWTKGGRPRVIPIVDANQRELLNEVHELAGDGSLIPPELNYKQQLSRYSQCISQAGFKNFHGLRHGYAQRRYHQLTGWHCPAAGGLKRVELAPEQKALDESMRLKLSRELGHNRIEITTTYIG